jgi:hypothetical protein
MMFPASHFQSQKPQQLADCSTLSKQQDNPTNSCPACELCSAESGLAASKHPCKQHPLNCCSPSIYCWDLLGDKLLTGCSRVRCERSFAHSRPNSATLLCTVADRERGYVASVPPKNLGSSSANSQCLVTLLALGELSYCI